MCFSLSTKTKNRNRKSKNGKLIVRFCKNLSQERDNDKESKNKQHKYIRTLEYWNWNLCVEMCVNNDSLFAVCCSFCFVLFRLFIVFMSFKIQPMYSMYNEIKLEVEKVEILWRTSSDCLNKWNKYIRKFFICETVAITYISARSYVYPFFRWIFPNNSIQKE